MVFRACVRARGQPCVRVRARGAFLRRCALARARRAPAWLNAQGQGAVHGFTRGSDSAGRGGGRDERGRAGRPRRPPRQRPSRRLGCWLGDGRPVIQSPGDEPDVHNLGPGGGGGDDVGGGGGGGREDGRRLSSDSQLARRSPIAAGRRRINGSSACPQLERRPTAATRSAPLRSMAAAAAACRRAWVWRGKQRDGALARGEAGDRRGARRCFTPRRA